MPRLVSRPDADTDVEAAFDWYEREALGLGQRFLDELRRTYDRIMAGPARYQVVARDIRRALLRRFPYAVYFTTEREDGRPARGSESIRVATTRVNQESSARH